jgi:histone H3/H4
VKRKRPRPVLASPHRTAQNCHGIQAADNSDSSKVAVVQVKTSNLEADIDLLLADPAVHKLVLSRLSAKGDDARAILINVGRELVDDSDSEDSSNSDDSEESDSEDDEIEEQDSLSDSESDDDDKLSDSDVESAIGLASCAWYSASRPDTKHAKRKRMDVRNKILSGVVTASIREIEDELAQVHREKSAEDAKIVAEMDGESASEADEEVSVQRDMLEECQNHLQDLTEDERPRLNLDVASPDAILTEIESIEDDIAEFEEVSEERDFCQEDMNDLLFTYYQLREDAELPDQDPRLADADAAALQAERLLEDEEPEDASLGDMKRATAALRAGIEAVMAASEPDARELKRKRDELEALMEIRAEQRSTATIIHSGAFSRLVREMGSDFMSDRDYTAGCFEALQAASEAYLVDLFESANLIAISAGRTKIFPEDMCLARRLSRVSLRAGLAAS